MKYAIILLLGLISFTGFSQSSEDNKLENAIFQIQNNGKQANSTIVTTMADKFDLREFEDIKKGMFRKEEIFKVDLINNGKSIRICHFTDIDVDGLKQFVLPFKETVHFEESVPYTL